MKHPSRFHEPSELLILLNQRFQELELGRLREWGQPWYRPPRHGPVALQRIAAAVETHAQANKSDPFAGPRMHLHLMRGLDNSGDVFKAARGQIHARSPISVVT